LAHDEQLHRPVAIKVPHRNLVSHPESAEAHTMWVVCPTTHAVSRPGTGARG
jgi:hypothetical protein